MNKLTVGQTVYLKPINNAARCGREIVEATVTKIGRKYFELDKHYYGRFFVDGMCQDGGQYVPDYQCYLSKQEIEDERERGELFSEIRQWLNGYSAAPLTLNQLRRIREIIQETP